ncbi:MAG: LD-carboxypeptidase [Trueperaceae bacterium]
MPYDILRPPRLRRGDTVAMVSLSAGLAAAFPHVIRSAERVLAERFELTLVAAPNAWRDDAFLRAHPEARADDLDWALESKEVRGVLSAIGGDDAVRVALLLEPERIRSNPKPFVGFSDTSAIHAAFARAGVVSFYGPALMSGIADGAGLPMVLDDFERALFGVEVEWLVTDPGVVAVDVLRWQRPDYAEAARAPREVRRVPGPAALQGDAIVEGRLVGGCGEVLEMLKGTKAWYPDRVWDDAVLLLETSEDVPPPDFVGYWLRNYGAMGVLARLAALLIARPRGYDDAQREALRRIVPDVLAEFGRDDLPVLFDLACGHTQPMHTLPLLSRVRVDPKRAALTVLEAGVT